MAQVVSGSIYNHRLVSNNSSLMMLLRCCYFLGLVIAVWLGMPFVCQAEETIHLQLRWHHQFQFAGYYAALQQGYYQQAGLNVVIHEGTPEKIPVTQVLKGEAHYGVANSELLLARLKGEPLMVLAAIYQHSPSVLLARKDANIYTPSDLVGKKVMMLGSYIDADFVAMFNNERIKIKDIDIIPSSFDIKDLVTGKIDVFNSYISNEPYFLQQQGIEYTILHPRNYGVDFYSDMLFTSEQEIKQHPQRVQAFLNASLRGWQYALAHPEDIITLLQHQYQVPKTKEHLEFEAKAVQALILPDLVEIGHINPWRLKYMAETFVQAGMVEHDKGLTNFIYQADASKDRLIHYLKLILGITVLISLIAAVLFISYRSIKRENDYRRRIEKELRQRTDELALHNNILQKINQGVALTELLNDLAKQVEFLHPRMICSILLLDEQARLRHGAAPSLPDFYNQQVDGLAIGDGVGSCGTAAYLGRRCIVEDIQVHEFWTPFRELAKQAGVRSCWSQPIKDSHGKVLGTFAIYHDHPSQPLAAEISLVESYASLAQLAIERTRANQALIDSEQRLRFVLKGSGLGFWDWKIDHQKIEINTSYADVFHHHCIEITDTVPSWLHFIYAEDREKTWQSIRKVLNGAQDIHQVEYRVLDKQGQIRWILDRANIVQCDAEGKPIRMSGTHTDITERKIAEQQLRDSEQRLNLCQFYGGIGTWEADLIHNRQIWSPAVTQLLGFPTVAQPSWEDFLAVIHPDDKQQVIEATETHIKQRTKYDVTYRIIDMHQQIRWMRSVGRLDTTNDDSQSSYFRGIVQDVTELKVAEAQIKQLAFYDYLTHLPNRRLLNERMNQAIQSEQRLAILMMDLDRFKAVNDSLGHVAGDELLQKVALRISEQLQETDLVARLGGDEFVVLLQNYDLSDVEAVALAIITRLNQPFILRETDVVQIGTSIGICFYPEQGNSPEILLDCADAALYQAKEQGRGCFCIAA